MNKPDNNKEKGKCSFSPFTFTLVLCVILGCILILVPIGTFDSYDYVKKIQFDMSAQFFMRQIGKYDSVVFTSNNKTGATMFVYKPDAVLTPVEKGWAVQYSQEHEIEAGDAMVIPFLYVKDTYMTADAFCKEGCLLEFKCLDQEQYDAYEASGKKYLKAGFGLSTSVKYNETFTTFGRKYAIVENKGKKASVSYKVMLKSPFYNVTSATPLYRCIDSAECKFENLPRNYFVVVDVATHEQSKVANAVTVTQQYNDKFRWGFPIGIYVSLFLIVLIVGVGQLIFTRVHKKSAPGSYSTIEDPLDKEEASIN